MHSGPIHVKYTDTALPGIAATVNLYDSSLDGVELAHLGVQRISWSIKHSGALTVKAYHRNEADTAWIQIYDSGSLAAPALTSRHDLYIGDFRHVKVDVLNGAAAQTTFDPQVALHTERSDSD